MKLYKNDYHLDTGAYFDTACSQKEHNICLINQSEMAMAV